MAEESASNGKESNGAARALSIPVIVLLLALLLIYFASTGYPGSGFSLGFPNPDVLGGEYRIS